MTHTTSRQNRNILGFTIIELLVAATILAILSAVALVNFSSAGVRARDGKRKADLEQVRSGLELYRSAVGSYPNVGSSWGDMITALYNGNYISSSTVTDPKAGAYAYIPVGDPPKTYQVCGVLESPPDTEYCLNNP